MITTTCFAEGDDIPTIGIIGQGFSGTVSAIRILELATIPLKLILFHSDYTTKYGGIAYGVSSCGWEHLLNIQAGRVSLFRETPSDFLDWVSLESLEERAEWPSEWRNHVFKASSAVPRRVYGQYLAARFKKAQKNSKLVDVIEKDAEVIMIQERLDKVILAYIDDAHTECNQICDRVIIATGHDTPLVPSALREAKPNKRIIGSPYSRDFAEGVAELNSDQPIMIIGTGLSAYDAALTLQYNKFNGTIYMLSRKNFTHNVYPGDHIHDIVSIPFSAIPADQLPAKEMFDLLENEITRGCDFLKATHTVEDDKVVKERVLKALEPWIAQWIQRSDSTQVQLFLDLAKSRLTTSRTGIVPEVNTIIYKLRNWDKRLHLRACDIEEVLETQNGFRVKPKVVDGKLESEIDVSLIVSCLGYNSDYAQTASPIWRHLLDHGLALIHPRTRRGVAVGKYGELVRRDGSISERIFAVGPMRQGDEIERNGRLGAFVFSVGTIRNQALLAGIRILWLTENSEYSTMDRFRRCEIDTACDAAFGDAITNKHSKHLVNTIMSVCLARDTSFLVDDQKLAVEKWLNRHLEDTVNHVIPPVGSNNNTIRHTVWYIALMRAAFVATDISRLAHDHYKVGNYMTGYNTEFIAEKLELSSILRASVAVFGASTASMLIYSPDDKKLYPFAMYRRVQSFTPTAYGEGVAGALVKAFYEGEQSTDLDPRLIFRDGPTIVGTYVPNYNQLHQDLKKEVYVGIERKFPAVLVSLLASQGHVLGIVYVEAESEKIFKLDDATLLRAMMTHKFKLIQEAQATWDRKSIPFYRFGDFEGADLHKALLCKQNLSQANFKKAYLADANLNLANLTGASFDLADLSNANMKSTTIYGVSFNGANLSKCKFNGADLRYCTFNKSDLTGSHIAGASFENCTFIDSQLSNIEFRDLDVSTINFTNAVMRNCVLKRLVGVEFAVWIGIDLTGSTIDDDVWNKLPDFVRDIHDSLVTRD
jgi:uncharacterized NAD(P)/FAD-binding protein YdhS/uncharacterized protein YjbI with pentapeptide repeats